MFRSSALSRRFVSAVVAAQSDHQSEKAPSVSNCAASSSPAPLISQCSSSVSCVASCSAVRRLATFATCMHAQQHRAFLSATAPALQGAVVSYQCSVCMKGFRLQNALNHHIMTKHAGQAKMIPIGKDGKPLPEGAATATGAPSPSSAAASAPKPAAAPSARPSMAAPSAANNTRPSPASSPVGARPASSPSSAPSAAAASPSSASAAAAAAPSSPASASSIEDDEAPASSDSNEKKFVCTICQKTFRLEHALHHHYQAKHNIDAPTPAMMGAAAGGADASAAAPSVTSASASAGASSPFSPTAGGASMSSFAAAAAGGAASRAAAAAAEDPSSTSNYVHSDGGTTPQTWQYHLDVAPNAPEEGEMASHHRLVNHAVLMGTIQDVQEGFVFEDAVVQFILVTQFESPSPGDPDKDLHTVRVYGSPEYLRHVRSMLRNSKRVIVSGRVRLVPQFEESTNKFYHYPIVMVSGPSGFITEV